jgi:hypothetical protein
MVKNGSLLDIFLALNQLEASADSDTFNYQNVEMRN